MRNEVKQPFPAPAWSLSIVSNEVKLNVSWETMALKGMESKKNQMQQNAEE